MDDPLSGVSNDQILRFSRYAGYWRAYAPELVALHTAGKSVYEIWEAMRAKCQGDYRLSPDMIVYILRRVGAMPPKPPAAAPPRPLLKFLQGRPRVRCHWQTWTPESQAKEIEQELK